MVGSIDPRCETLRGTHWPVKVAGVFGTRVAENHLGPAVHRPYQQPGHMDESDPIRPRKTLAARGPSTYGSRLCRAPPRGAAPRPGHRTGIVATLVFRRRRRGRSRCRGLGCGLRRAADDHRQQTLAPQPLRGLLGVVEGYGVDDGVALFDVVD